MQNGLEVTDFLTMECLRQLKNELFIAGGFRSDFSKNYTKEFAVGETIRVPLPWRPMGGEGLTYDPEPVDRRHTSITVDQIPHVHFEWNSVEEALKLTRGEEALKEQITDPAAQRMRQSIEIMAAQHAAINSPNVLGTLQTDPTTLGFAGQSRARLIEMGGWLSTKRRTAAISTSVMQSIVQAATVTTPIFNPGSKVGKAFVEGYLGENGGFEFQESMSLPIMTAGTRAGACTVSGSDQSGASLLIACTSGDTFVAGEKFSIASRYPINPGTLTQANTTAFQVAIAGTWGQTYTATSGTITLPLTDSIEGPGSGYQNITALPQNGDVITFWPGTTSPNGKQGRLSVLFTKDAFALCGVKLANPQQGGAVQIASQARDPETGISVAMIRMFDPIERRWVNRLDALLGFGNFYNRNCSVVFAGA